MKQDVLKKDSQPQSADSGVPADVPLHVVGIGASAGGLESLERLFKEMPLDTDMAFVVIQHLSPDFKSLMDELLARYTELAIHRAEEGMQVEANSIYLIPPKKEMIISNGRLLLTDKDPKQPLTMPIDRFLKSLAQDFGDRAVGVILSGTGSDGSRGIRDIHNVGGLVICETKETAKFDGMPQAALETGVVDQVMPPESIPQALVNYKDKLPFGEGEAGANDAPPEAIDAVFKLLNDSFGIDFSHYKPNTVSRRIQRRLSMVGARTLEQYAERLAHDRDELNALYKDLLIGVTRFFRDREAFQRLEDQVVPDLIHKSGQTEEIRVWVAGCGTGEEAYSVAMILHEQLEAAGQPINVKIFATDVHRASLDFAGAGVYEREALADVGSERLDRYFIKHPDGYHVVPELRQMIVFATHNVISDAPFTKLDLITCRNLLIYFQPAAQSKALSLFHFGLKTRGWLFLGPSESPGELNDELEIVDAHWKLFRKSRNVRLPHSLELPIAKGLPLKQMPPIPLPNRGVSDTHLVAAYDAILDKYMPPGFLINERRELLHTFGGAERYLTIKGGRPTADVLDMFDRELRTAVTGAVTRVLRDHKPVTYSGVRVQSGDREQKLRVKVEEVKNPRANVLNLMILMEPLGEPSIEPETTEAVDEVRDMRRMSQDRINALEGELRYSKENLQATIEELETSNEEMQATNEELVASNEELQSTNEELQSVNEELYTVNAEYQKKIAELSELTSDMDNLLESTDVGTIFLDRELRIRKFTPQIGQDFHLLPQDIGRSINSFAHNIVHPGLIDDLKSVVTSEYRIEREVRDRQGEWLYLRILPYQTKSKRVEGVVLTLINITPMKKAQSQLAEAVSRRDDFLAMLSHELRNPLGAILNAAKVMELLEFTDETAQETFNVIQRQGRHVSRLLDDLLDVSRVTRNKIELNRVPTDLQSIVQSAVDIARPMMEECGLQFTEEISDQPLLVDADGVRMQQALYNLLSNAARYTPPGGQVLLEAKHDQGEVVFRVSDTGTGISADELDSIFDLFFQSDLTLHRSECGMGIGLTLVQSIVDMHQGTITVHSEGTGKGSKFEIRLPSMECVPEDAAVLENGEPELTLTGDGGVVVVVEDQDDARNMLQTLLELENYEVHTAENGTKGLALIERVHPDVALIDIGLPGMDGYELATQLRQNLGNSHTFLVALTGYGQPGDIEAAFQAGFDDHLVKPLDTQKLSSILARHAQKQQKQ